MFALIEYSILVLILVLIIQYYRPGVPLQYYVLCLSVRPSITPAVGGVRPHVRPLLYYFCQFDLSSQVLNISWITTLSHSFEVHKNSR